MEMAHKLKIICGMTRGTWCRGSIKLITENAGTWRKGHPCCWWNCLQWCWPWAKRVVRWNPDMVFWPWSFFGIPPGDGWALCRRCRFIRSCWNYCFESCLFPGSLLRTLLLHVPSTLLLGSVGCPEVLTNSLNLCILWLIDGALGGIHFACTFSLLTGPCFDGGQLNCGFKSEFILILKVEHPTKFRG